MERKHIVTLYTLGLVALMGAVLISAVYFEVRTSFYQRIQEEQEDRMRVAWHVLKRRGEVFRIEDGKLLVGDTALNANNETVDEITALVSGVATIYQGEDRIATAFPLPGGNRAIGTRADCPEAVATVLRGEKPLRQQYVPLDLGERYLAAFDPIRDDQGNVIGMLEVATRMAPYSAALNNIMLRSALITLAGMAFVGIVVYLALNRMTREIRSLAESRSLILESAGEGICGTDASGACTFVNRAGAKMLGYDPAEIIGQHFWDLARPPGPGRPAAPPTGRYFDDQCFRRKDGKDFPVEFIASPMMEKGAPVGMVFAFQDIAERKEHEAEIARKNKEIADALAAVASATRAKGQFFRNMSHEIRTPMNAILGASSVMLNHRLPPEIRSLVETSYSSGDALMRIIDQILDFSLIESGQLVLQHAEFEVGRCLDDALANIAPKAAERHVDLAYELDDSAPSTLVADEKRVGQAIATLVGGALTVIDGGRLLVHVSGAPGTEGRSRVTFSIRGWDVPFRQDEIEGLFRSYSQADITAMRSYGGLGLGLAISKHVAELMGGELRVNSLDGHGSTLDFVIEVLKGSHAVQRHISVERSTVSGRHLLVVQRDVRSRDAIAGHASAWSVRALMAGAPHEAVSLLQSGQPVDVALIAHEPPDLDARALARAIRQESAGASLPLLLLTDANDPGQPDDEYLFAAIIYRPLVRSHLLEAMRHAVAGRPPATGAPGAEARIEAGAGQRRPMRILITEDALINQEIAHSLLREMGYEADIANNGAECLDALERNPYDVILMDVRMPIMDGFEATREIRRRLGSAGPHIIATTADAMQGDREACLASGMDNYLTKPLRVEELQRALARAYEIVISRKAHA